MTHTQRCEKCRYVGDDFEYIHGHFSCPRCRQVGEGDCCQGAPIKSCEDDAQKKEER